MSNFSYKSRAEILDKLGSSFYDVVIIGGGITGAGIALDAASRGLKTALIEKNDFASGTSSKSTKLIHGGLRYLKQLHFKMVADVGRERKIVHRIARHLVLPEKMLLPIVKGGSMGKFSASIGLKLYDFLAGVKGDDRRKMMGKRTSLQVEPLLPENILLGAGLYAEYRTDDARLTVELIKTARAHGCDCINYVKANDFLYIDKKVTGVNSTDRITEKEIKIKGNFIINAAGPWVDELREINHSRKGKRLMITKGVHLVIDRDKLPVKHSVYFDLPDGRMAFVIPRNLTTYIGTTDVKYEGGKDNLTVPKSDAVYLIDGVNKMFPSINITLSDINSSWAGLRPLIYEEGKSASEISRKDEIFVSDSGLYSIAGGKLTGYRKMAKKVINPIARKLKIPGKCKTLKIKLIGNRFSSAPEVTDYTNDIKNKISKLGLPEFYAAYLVHNYGVQTDDIIDNMENGKDREKDLLMAELAFCFENEMVCFPLDFIERRTGRLYFWIDSIDKYLDDILNSFKSNFDWTKGQLETEKTKIQEILYQSRNFK